MARIEALSRPAVAGGKRDSERKSAELECGASVTVARDEKASDSASDTRAARLEEVGRKRERTSPAELACGAASVDASEKASDSDSESSDDEHLRQRPSKFSTIRARKEATSHWMLRYQTEDDENNTWMVVFRNTRDKLMERVDELATGDRGSPVAEAQEIFGKTGSFGYMDAFTAVMVRDGMGYTSCDGDGDEAKEERGRLEKAAHSFRQILAAFGDQWKEKPQLFVEACHRDQVTVPPLVEKGEGGGAIA
jgi:hypothetical protein